MTDKLQRQINYLRLSITDRCNFNCLYCCGGTRQKFIPHDQILRYEELLRMVGIMVTLGVRKVRITGGEPLARKGAVDFIARLRQSHPELALALTTNGSLLSPWIDQLAAIGLQAINISLDSWRPDTFKQITGSGALGEVRDNIERLVEAGVPVKINAVALRGISDVELDDFIAIVRQLPIDLRFIEFMPVGANTVWNSARFLPWADLYALVAQKAPLVPVAEKGATDGPARMYRIEGFAGRIGFISAVSEHFCQTCNRLRLTAAGDLRTCLFSDRQCHLAPLLRSPRTTDQILEEAIIAACQAKPVGAELLAARAAGAVAARQMVGIGG